MNIPIDNRGYDDRDAARRDTEQADLRKDLIVRTIMYHVMLRSLVNGDDDFLFKIACKVWEQLNRSPDNISVWLAGYLAGLDLDIPEHCGWLEALEEDLMNKYYGTEQ